MIETRNAALFFSAMQALEVVFAVEGRASSVELTVPFGKAANPH